MYGLVSDNAANNCKLVEYLGKQGWENLDGEKSWVRCFAHTLNLVAQVSYFPRCLAVSASFGADGATPLSQVLLHPLGSKKHGIQDDEDDDIGEAQDAEIAELIGAANKCVSVPMSPARTTLTLPRRCSPRSALKASASRLAPTMPTRRRTSLRLSFG